MYNNVKDNNTSSANSQVQENTCQIYEGHSHSFDTGIAKKLGLNAATVFNHIVYWLRINAKKKINIHDGTVWMYESRKEIAEFLEYLTEQQVKDAISKLFEAGLLIKGNYSKSPMDRTTWYSVSNQEILGIQKILTIGSTDPMQKVYRPNAKGPQTQCIYNEQEEHHKEQQTNKAPTESALIACLSSFASEISPTAMKQLEALPIENVEQAVKHISTPGFVISKDVQSAIIYFAQDPSRIKKSAVQSKEEKRQFVENLWSKCKKFGNLDILSSGVEYHRGNYICDVLSWNENGFMDQLESLLRKRGEL